MRRRFVALVLLALLAPVQLRASEAEEAADDVDALEARWLARPDDVVLGLALQDALLAKGQQARAVALFRRVSERQPEDLALSFLAARARRDERGLAAMRTAVAANLGRSSSDGRGLLASCIALAVAEVEAGNAQGAAAAAERVASLRGEAADWIYLGWIRRVLLRQPGLAIDAYRRALHADASSTSARSALVSLLREAGAAHEALTLATEGVRLHPEDSTAHLDLGLAHAARGRTQDALVALEKARELARRDAGALAAVGGAFVELGRAADARRAYEDALALDPEQGRALAGAGMLALDEGRPKEARELLGRAAKVRPRDARVAFFQGVAAQRLGLHASAVTAYRRAVDLDPERVEYVAALGLAHREKGTLASALMMLERAVDMAPQDAGLRLQLGITWMRKRDWKRARDAFLAAAERDPRNPRPHFYLAVIHGDKLGRAAEALDDLERYAKLGGEDPRALAWLADLRAQLGER